jgi:pimeloyl-ACP methyl ester carboxylesterase
VNEDLTPFMPQIKSPVLLVWGEDDRDTPVASARVMERLIPDSELVVLENAGHFSYVDQPYQFLLQVKRFLRN